MLAALRCLLVVRLLLAVVRLLLLVVWLLLVVVDLLLRCERLLVFLQDVAETLGSRLVVLGNRDIFGEELDDAVCAGTRERIAGGLRGVVRFLAVESRDRLRMRAQEDNGCGVAVGVSADEVVVASPIRSGA